MEEIELEELDTKVAEAIKVVQSKIAERQKHMLKKKEYEDKAKVLADEIINTLQANNIRSVDANDGKNGKVQLKKKTTSEIPFITLFEKTANKYIEEKDVYVISRERLEQLSLACKVVKKEVESTYSKKEIANMEEVTKVEEKYEFNAR